MEVNTDLCKQYFEQLGPELQYMEFSKGKVLLRQYPNPKQKIGP